MSPGMPQPDPMVKLGMLFFVVLLVAVIAVYHVWLDRRLRVRRTGPAGGDDESVPRTTSRPA